MLTALCFSSWHQLCSEHDAGFLGMQAGNPLGLQATPATPTRDDHILWFLASLKSIRIQYQYVLREIISLASSKSSVVPTCLGEKSRCVLDTSNPSTQPSLPCLNFPGYHLSLQFWHELQHGRPASLIAVLHTQNVTGTQDMGKLLALASKNVTLFGNRVSADGIKER